MNTFDERFLGDRPEGTPGSGEPPTPEELAKIAGGLGLSLTAEQLAEYTALVARGMSAYARLDELNPVSPAFPGRLRDLGRAPRTDEDPCHGWAWRCSIRGASDGPLAGRRVAVKDNIAVAGLPMRPGAPLPESFVPRADATVVTRLLDAGAEIVGKTAAFGTGTAAPEPRNPYAPDRLPGGTSGGNAVVIAAGQADLTLGTDHGGSIRVPAAWSGCVGLKPTFALVPYTGIVPVERTLDHVGPMAATVADCALLLEVTAGGDGLDSRQRIDLGVGSFRGFLDGDLGGVRVAVLREGFGIPGVSEPDVDAAALDAVDSLAAGGARVEEVSVPMHRDGLAIWNAIAVQGATDLAMRGDTTTTNWDGHVDLDMMERHRRGRLENPQALSPALVFTALLGTYMSQRHGHRYYAKAQNLARELRRQYTSVLERFDVLALPTVGMKAVSRHTDGSATQIVDRMLGNLHNTAPFSMTGNPALSIPCAFSEGLPVGLMLVGRPYDDEAVLRVGHAYERLRGPLSRAAASEPADLASVCERPVS
ncbi:amidase [Actinomadura xylanilytica]|uniref:amidase n=1 Tax=Actinomadura xylanilytica TaxID=887459 RepID=UPI00255A72BE|nr:amidase [Actinomadura xylanilytica]MDL4774169.1 amidase [Actinomadura xylanilytica]